VGSIIVGQLLQKAHIRLVAFHLCDIDISSISIADGSGAVTRRQVKPDRERLVTVVRVWWLRPEIERVWVENEEERNEQAYSGYDEYD
jgi:hypothetical protein